MGIAKKYFLVLGHPFFHSLTKGNRVICYLLFLERGFWRVSLSVPVDGSWLEVSELPVQDI